MALPSNQRGQNMTRIPKGGRAARIVLLALTALAIGAVFGTATNGQASAKDKPSSTAPPTITGTTSEGSTLTASDGTWSGTTPMTFKYQWGRCDGSGGSCADIGGATAKTYKLTHADAGNTIRVTVTATNADGSADATSVPTAVVAGAPPTVVNGCPAGGTGTIQVKDVAPPARLTIDQQTANPRVVTRSTGTLQVHYRVTACDGRPVQGALAYSAVVPFNQYSIPQEATTGADGTVNLTMTQLRGFPAARQQRLLVVFARARKPGDDLVGGISTRLLVSFPVSLRR
jgi:hypothetical protein